MSGMLSPAAVTISSSASANGAQRARARRLPIEVLPAPIRPTRTMLRPSCQGALARNSASVASGEAIGSIRLDIDQLRRQRYKAACLERGNRQLATGPSAATAECAVAAILGGHCLAPLHAGRPLRRRRRRYRLHRHLGRPGPDQAGRDRCPRREPATLGRLALSCRGCCPGLAPAAVAVSLLALPAAAQEVPRALFPPPQSAPEVVMPPSTAAAIKVEDLTPPESTSLGLADAEAELGGPLWTKGVPPDLPELLSRLPASITEPTLAGLQRSLLAAPMPMNDGADALFLLRLDRLLAMGEGATALQLLAQVQDGTKGPELELRRLQARFAAGQVEPACAAAKAQMVA